ncbi:peptidase c15 pyroglutamyl peptidase i [Lucifera butyrica]|uniref:Pyrrolidone-carboxylate peptidase n=1 Tax=Lucifera butyrica TaxID=1351585 RepID=A0A498RE97_9FIRM|nr:pyroglutamyl-peptidase I [Lucifera butyrica]VBB09811.1 peptidase c15 pyroglutamyl peptidase i [Lucifera butyrica]
MKTRVLITGFEPFDGEAVNPALEAVKQLNGRIIAGAAVITRPLPVVRWKAITALKEAITQVNPDLIIAVGQGLSVTEIQVERIAINVDDFRIQDNEGRQPVDEPIEPDGPAAYWSTLPVKKMVAVMREGGIPASVSNTAGTFVCNHLFYGLMHLLSLEGSRRRGGFIHIPYLPEQAVHKPGQPSMGLDTVLRGLETAVACALSATEDGKFTGGTLC